MANNSSTPSLGTCYVGLMEITIAAMNPLISEPFISSHFPIAFIREGVKFQMIDLSRYNLEPQKRILFDINGLHQGTTGIDSHDFLKVIRKWQPHPLYSSSPQSSVLLPPTIFFSPVSEQDGLQSNSLPPSASLAISSSPVESSGTGNPLSIYPSIPPYASFVHVMSVPSSPPSFHSMNPTGGDPECLTIEDCRLAFSAHAVFQDGVPSIAQPFPPISSLLIPRALQGSATADATLPSPLSLSPLAPSPVESSGTGGPPSLHPSHPP